MSVRMSDGEVREFLATGHTGILATLRADGSPAVMPLWYVMVDESVFVRTLASSPKAHHVRADPRVSFLVESGRAWAELKAVVIYGDAVIETAPDVVATVDAAFAAKYQSFLMPTTADERTRRHYAGHRLYVRIAPRRRVLTWDNSKLRPKP
jgi:PPOX class probable F420-dependent enzyme